MIDLEPPRESVPPEDKKRSIWPTILMSMIFVAMVGGVAYLFNKTLASSGDATGPQASTPAITQTNAPPKGGDSVEPIADAAEVILPSVVQIQTDTGVGSGVIYDAGGLILTAAHVVDGSNTVTVRFADGEELKGTVVGAAADADVAVIKVDRTGLPAATLALGELPRVGQMAIAVGSPWGLQSTVTAGIISAVNQPLGCNVGGSCRAMLQTDAAINPGNSGGALVDRFGRVLGINVSIFTLSGANDGVGFAVPIDIANDIATRLVTGQSLATAYMGVSGSDVDSGRAGALINEVVPGTGAADAGIQVGDLVVSIGGVRVQGIADLASQVRSHNPGSTVEVVVVRNGQEMTLRVLLGELPAN